MPKKKSSKSRSDKVQRSKPRPKVSEKWGRAFVMEPFDPLLEMMIAADQKNVELHVAIWRVPGGATVFFRPLASREIIKAEGGQVPFPEL